METVKIFLVMVSIVFAGCRIGGVTNDFFKDFAHVWIGGLIGAWIVSLKCEKHWLEFRFANILFLLWVVLIVVEVATAVIQRI